MCVYTYIQKKLLHIQCILVYDSNLSVTWQCTVGRDRRRDILIRAVREHRALPTVRGWWLSSWETPGFSDGLLPGIRG